MVKAKRVGSYEEVVAYRELRKTKERPFLFLNIARSRKRVGLPYDGYVKSAREFNRHYLDDRRNSEEV